MTYTKPELDIKKFDILEAIMADGASAIGGEIIPSEPNDESEDGGNISGIGGNDLIIG